MSSHSNHAQQRLLLILAIGSLVIGAMLVLAFATKLPLPARLFIAFTDAAIAAVLWVVLRQKFPKA